MPDPKLKHLRVAVLVSDGFEEAELLEPRKALDEAGAETTVIAPQAGKVQGINHGEKAGRVTVDLTLDKASPDDFDAVLLPGGALNADHLRVEKGAQEFIRSVNKDGKPIAVICHAPWLLVSAGLVKGRTLTSYHTIQDDIRNAGGSWKDEPVVRDRNWVSSRQPADIPAFTRQMITLFAERKAESKSA